MKRIEAVQTIEYGKDKKTWNGERRYFHTFVEQLRKAWKVLKVDTAVKSFTIQEAPIGVQDMLRRYNLGIMEAGEFTKEGGIKSVAVWMQIVSGYEKNDTEAREKGDAAMQVLESMIGKEVMQLTKEIREDEDVISLTRVRTAMDVIKTNYGQEDVGTQIKVNMEITQIGYCETHKDVTLNIEMLDAYQAEKKAIAGMTPMSDMEMVQHLVSRFPKAKDRQGVRSTTQVFYENMLEEISMKQTADVKWTDVVEHRRAKLDIRRMMGEEEEEQETKKESFAHMSVRQGEDNNWRGGNRDNRGGGRSSGHRTQGRSSYETQGRGNYGWQGRSNYGGQDSRNEKFKTCYLWTNGTCRYGEQCKFSHDDKKQDKENGGRKERDIRAVKKVNSTRKRDSESESEDEEEEMQDERNHKLIQVMLQQSEERAERRKQKKKRDA